MRGVNFSTERSQPAFDPDSSQHGRCVSDGPNRNRPLRVLWVDLNDSLDPSNWSGTPRQIIRSLQQAGVDVVTFGSENLFFRKAINWILHRYYRYARKLFYHIDRDLFWVKFFTWLVNRRLRHVHDADAIVCPFPPFAAFLRTNLPIVVIHDATWGQVVESYPWFNPGNQPDHIVANGFELEQITYSRKDVHAVLTSKWAADRAIEDYGLDRKRSSVIPFGANLVMPPTAAEVESALKRRGQAVCRLLFIGKEWLRKGGPIAIETTAKLVELGVPAELHVVGPAELIRGTEPAASLPDFVHLHGFLRKDLPEESGRLEKLYMESDFFILPTQAEALGVVFAEAAAHGLPSLGTFVGGVPSILRDQLNGAIFSPENPASEMAAWIKRKFLDREAYLRLARMTRQDYKIRLSADAYGNQLRSLIESVIRQHPRPDAPELFQQAG